MSPVYPKGEIGIGGTLDPGQLGLNRNKDFPANQQGRIGTRIV